MISRRTQPLDIGPELCDEYARTHDRQIVLRALESIDFTDNTVSRRKNAQKPGDTAKHFGFCVGLTETRKGPMASAAVSKRPNLARLLCSFAGHELPGVTFTSIQVNKDNEMALHIDRNDSGDDQHVIGLGGYSGGSLWYDDGESAIGTAVDVREHWLHFSGHRPHGVLPFTGRRYSVVYFTRAGGFHGGDIGAVPSSPLCQCLTQLGFPLPVTVAPVMRSVKTSKALKTARVKLAAFKHKNYQRPTWSRDKKVQKQQDKRRKAGTAARPSKDAYGKLVSDLKRLVDNPEVLAQFVRSL